MSGRTESGVLSTRDTVPSATSAVRATSTTVGGEGCLAPAGAVEFSTGIMRVRIAASSVVDARQPLSALARADAVVSAKGTRGPSCAGVVHGSRDVGRGNERIKSFHVFHGQTTGVAERRFRRISRETRISSFISFNVALSYRSQGNVARSFDLHR